MKHKYCCKNTNNTNNNKVNVKSVDEQKQSTKWNGMEWVTGGEKLRINAMQI